jgi:Flp pilus assembly pilin Flp
MSNYVKSTNFATKDSLASGNPAKIVKGTELNTEFDNIASAITSKADANNVALTGTATAVNLTVSGTFTATVDGGTY